MKITFKLSDAIVKLKCIAQTPLSYITCGHRLAICGEFRVSERTPIEEIQKNLNNDNI